jgi:hypothetical protein
LTPPLALCGKLNPEKTPMRNPSIEAPTRQQIYDEIGFESMRQQVESAAGGEYVTEVFLRECDDTYWQVYYFISIDGYVNGLLSSDYCNPAEITQVKPVPVTITKYISV